MKSGIKKTRAARVMRVATVFTGAAACAVTFAPAATAGTAQPTAAHPGYLRQGIRPNTETGCNSHVCTGLYGGGQYVSSVNGHWYGGTGCHLGHIDWYNPNGEGPHGTFSPNTYYCSKGQIAKIFNQDFPVGETFCVWFSNVNNELSYCEAVR
jgi:hypothetical protein